jgi:serine/threonine protein kinase
MERLFKRFGRAAKTENPMVSAFFERHEIRCPGCRSGSDAASMPPLQFVACPSCGATLFSPLQLKDFLLVEPAGAGGLASVYKAFRQGAVGELFAVKVLRDEIKDDPVSEEAFFAEARIHSLIPDHPNLVHYIDSGIEGPYAFYAMNYVTGEPLMRRVESHGRIAEPKALYILERALDVMEHIVAEGFLYRDVNAGNVILCDDDEPMLLDFGLTLPLEVVKRPQGKVKQVDGTPEFLPPERLYGTGEDERSTIYSLGLLTYYMLAGESMMKGRSSKSMAHKHVAKLRISHVSIPDDVSNAAMEMVNRMVAQKPEDRYPSFRAAHEAVQALLQP